MTFLQTLFISMLPATFSGLVAYLVAFLNSRKELKQLHDRNEHDIQRLLNQHQLDIDSLEKKHLMDMETSEKEHSHKIEIMQKEHDMKLLQVEKEAENSAKYGALGSLMSNPETLKAFLKMFPNAPNNPFKQ